MSSRRARGVLVLAFVLQLVGVACSTREVVDLLDAPATDAPTGGDAAGAAPVALVYRGPGACEGCAEALAAVLERAGYATRYVDAAALRRDATFVGASLYAQPGGDETTQVFDAVGAASWPAAADRIRAFVRGGGAYLGVCLGGFLAGEWLDDALTTKALDLLDGDVSTFEHTPEPYEDDQVIVVDWLRPAARRHVYFQEGPVFAAKGTVYARYSDGSTAALLATYGQGQVAVSGIHFEADADWYAEHDLEDPDGLDADLGLALLRDLAR